MRRVKRAVSALPPVDERRRYSLAAAAEYLDISQSKLFTLMRANEIAVIRDGGRSFIPGSEIVARSCIAA